MLDLTGLTFIGADGIDAMLACRQHAQKRGSQIRLANPNGQVRHLFELTRLDHIFDIYDSVDAAIQAR